jgi:type II secretory pathway component PulF
LLTSEEHKGMRIVLQDLIDQLSEWMELGDAMERHRDLFWQDEIELVKASQIAWNLVETLNDIADNLEQSGDLSWKIKKAMMFPIILFFGAIWAALYIDISVLPNITGLFTDQEALPW